MPEFCCVPKCKTSSLQRKSEGVSFHEFPSNADLCALWVAAIGRKNWFPNSNSNSSRVCSKHFLPEDFKIGLKVRRLNPQVIPSVFEDKMGNSQWKKHIHKYCNAELHVTSTSSQTIAVNSISTSVKAQRSVPDRVTSTSNQMITSSSKDIAKFTHPPEESIDCVSDHEGQVHVISTNNQTTPNRSRTGDSSSHDTSLQTYVLEIQASPQTSVKGRGIQVDCRYSLSERRKWLRKCRDQNQLIVALKYKLKKQAKEMKELKGDALVQAPERKKWLQKCRDQNKVIVDLQCKLKKKAEEIKELKGGALDQAFRKVCKKAGENDTNARSLLNRVMNFSS